MSRFLIWMAVLVFGVTGSAAVLPASVETADQKEARMKWWTEARFGMFIHWGLYALPARHEWVKNRERITDEAYRKYFDHFDPDLYNPAEWARAAKNAGMKYFVVTAKHHEGLLPLGLQAHGLQGPEDARRAGTSSSRWSRPCGPKA